MWGYVLYMCVIIKCVLDIFDYCVVEFLSSDLLSLVFVFVVLLFMCASITYFFFFFF